MALTLAIDDPKTLERIERLRLGMEMSEFLSRCFRAGLAQAEIEYKKLKKPAPVNSSKPLPKKSLFDRAKPQFRKLHVPEVLAAVRKTDKNPIQAEVFRLAQDMTKALEAFRDKRNALKLDLPPLFGIEQIALDIAMESLNRNPKKRKASSVH